MTRHLRDELKMTRPFKSLEEEAGLSIARTFALMDHAFSEALKPYAITPTQYNVLRILRGAGENGLCRNEVGMRLVTKVPDVTRLLDRMEEAGLISRKRIGSDRRYVTTTITDKGLKLVDKLDPEVAGLNEKIFGKLGQKPLRDLIEVLAEARERLAGDCSEPGTTD